MPLRWFRSAPITGVPIREETEQAQPSYDSEAGVTPVFTPLSDSDGRDAVLPGVPPDCPRQGCPDMLCILYVNFIGGCLSIIGHLVERALPATFARRWMWLAVIVFSMALPGYYRYHHSWDVPAAGSVHAAGQAAEQTAPQLGLATTLLSPFDRDFWARIESYDTKINRVWLIVSGLLLIWAVTNAMRVSHVIGSSRGEQTDPGIPTMIDGVPILVTDVAGPATVGVVRSRVLVPKWVLGLPGAQRKYVLRHEDEHRRAHDARLLFVASLPLVLAPWNLALWWELRRLCLAVE